MSSRSLEDAPNAIQRDQAKNAAITSANGPSAGLEYEPPSTQTLIQTGNLNGASPTSQPNFNGQVMLQGTQGASSGGGRASQSPTEESKMSVGGHAQPSGLSPSDKEPSDGGNSYEPPTQNYSNIKKVKASAGMSNNTGFGATSDNTSEPQFSINDDLDSNRRRGGLLLRAEDSIATANGTA